MSEFPHFADLLGAQNAISHIPSADTESALESQSLLSSGSPAPCPREAFKKYLLNRISRNRNFFFHAAICNLGYRNGLYSAEKTSPHFAERAKGGTRKEDAEKGKVAGLERWRSPISSFSSTLTRPQAIQGGSSGGRGVSPSQGGLTDSRRPLRKAAADDPSRSPSTADPAKLPHPRALGKNRRRFAQGASSQSFAFLPKALPKPRLASCPPTYRAGVARP